MSMSTKDKQKIRNKAQRYAIKFLIQKYKSEYKELYKAYLINRGVSLQGDYLETLIDERELLKQKG